MQKIIVLFAFALFSLSACDNEASSQDCVGDECTDHSECTLLGCELGQLCTSSIAVSGTTIGDDNVAVCIAQCADGLWWDALLQSCEPLGFTCDEGMEGSLFNRCQELNQSCTMVDSGASCGTCNEGYVKVADGSCVPDGSCAALQCDRSRRTCRVLATGPACGPCMPGFREEFETCVPIKSCDELSCENDAICLESNGVNDAQCVFQGETCSVSDREGLVDDDGFCHLCGSCDGPGENGPFLGRLSLENKCICETKPGYYWEESLSPHAASCDADGDGWVRESALVAMDTEEGTAVRENARCQINQIQSVRLVNEQGQIKDVVLEAPVPMIESDRNDDASLMAQAIAAGDIPDIGVSPANWTKGLNSLTKLCIGTDYDFDDNGIVDLEHWQQQTNLSAVRESQQALVEWAYFAELYNQSIERIDGDQVRLVIRESSRTSSLFNFGYRADASTQWQQCDRKPDADYLQYKDSSVAMSGLDFAHHTPVAGSWSGMNHHSQFKCIEVVESVDEFSPRHHVRRTDLLGEPNAIGYVPQSCTGHRQSASNQQGFEADCAVHDGTISNGDVYWASVEYRDTRTRYRTKRTLSEGEIVNLDPEYTRGCVSQCTYQEELSAQCAGYNSDPYLDNSFCVADRDSFGLLECGCNSASAGGDCSISCSSENFAVSNSFTITVRTSECSGGVCNTAEPVYWLCGTAGYYAASEITMTADTGLYPAATTEFTLTPDIPRHRSNGARTLCQDADDCGSGFSIR